MSLAPKDHSKRVRVELEVCILQRFKNTNVCGQEIGLGALKLADFTIGEMSKLFVHIQFVGYLLLQTGSIVHCHMLGQHQF